jgi:hypothetical protein
LLWAFSLLLLCTKYKVLAKASRPAGVMILQHLTLAVSGKNPPMIPDRPPLTLSEIGPYQHVNGQEESGETNLRSNYDDGVFIGGHGFCG